MVTFCVTNECNPNYNTVPLGYSDLHICFRKLSMNITISKNGDWLCMHFIHVACSENTAYNNKVYIQH
jgi:hypothetical protein